MGLHPSYPTGVPYPNCFQAHGYGNRCSYAFPGGVDRMRDWNPLQGSSEMWAMKSRLPRPSSPSSGLSSFSPGNTKHRCKLKP